MRKPINYIFIDTSVFKKESYFKDKGGVARLFDLAAKGWVKIIMPEIAKKEWWKHYAQATHLKFDEVERKAMIMGNTEEAENFVNAYRDLTASYEEIARNAFEQHLADAGVLVLPIAYSQDTLERVVDKYFAQEKPFGTQSKRKEFPDAFILTSLEKYAQEKDIDSVLIFSTDNDMLEYNSELFETKEIGAYLNDLITNRIPQFEEAEKRKRDERDVSRMVSYVKEHGELFYPAIREHVKHVLTDESLYSERFHYADIDEVYVDKIKTKSSTKGMETLSIEEDQIRALYFVDIDTIVNVHHFCEEDSIWDSEDKKYIYEAYTNTDVEISSYVKVTLTLDRKEFDMGQDPKIEIEDIDTDNLTASINDEPQFARQQPFASGVDITKFSQPSAAIQAMTNITQMPDSLNIALSSINNLLSAINQFKMPTVTEGLRQMTCFNPEITKAIDSLKQIQTAPAITAFNSIAENLAKAGYGQMGQEK